MPFKLDHRLDHLEIDQMVNSRAFCYHFINEKTFYIL